MKIREGSYLHFITINLHGPTKLIVLRTVLRAQKSFNVSLSLGGEQELKKSVHIAPLVHSKEACEQE